MKLESPRYCFQRQEECPRAGGKFNEVIGCIKGFGRIIDRVHEQSPNSDLLRHLQCSQQRILEQAAANTGMLIVNIDGKPAEDHYRHRIGQAMPDPARHVRAGHAPCREAVIAHDSDPIPDDIGSSGSPLAFEGKLAKPVVE